MKLSVISKLLVNINIKMKSCCLKCRKHSKKNAKVSKTSNRRIMMLSKCAICSSKKSRSKRTIQ